jgi:hypothetical protein
MTTIEDSMLDLKEMIRKQAEEIERMNRERETWKKQQEEFQAILANLGMCQQLPQLHENQQEGRNPQMEKQVSMVGSQMPPTNPAIAHLQLPDLDQVAENDMGIGGCHNPFTLAIMKFDMPANFKFAVQIDPYDGTTDPQDHVEIFQQTMIFQGAKEPVICRAFPLTLKAAARRWFSSLPAGSVTGWKALKDKFVSNFTSSKQQLRDFIIRFNAESLERIKQRLDEPLRDFIIRFNAESLEVRDVAPNMVLYFLR